MQKTCNRSNLVSVSIDDGVIAGSCLRMFYMCTSLTNVDLDGLDTSRTENMDGMFQCCTSLDNINVDLDTGSLKSAGNMFDMNGSSALKNINFGTSFKFENVEDIHDMFTHCDELTSLDISGFNLSNLDSSKCYDAFHLCGSLAVIKTPAVIKTGISISLPDTYYIHENDKNIAYTVLQPNATMFTSAAKFTVSFNTEGGSAVTDQKVTYYTMASKPDAPARSGYTFADWYKDEGCTEPFDFTSEISADTTVYAGWTKNPVADYTACFTENTSNPPGSDGKSVGTFPTGNYVVLTKYNGSEENITVPATVTVKGIEYHTVLNGGVFCDYSKPVSAKSITVESGVYTGTSCESMFSWCKSLETLDISGLDTSRATTMLYMFFGDGQLKTLDISHLNTANVTNMHSMFQGCPVSSLDLSNFDTSKVETMWNMFSGCSSLERLDLSTFNTSKVTVFNNMFGSCSSLKYLNLSSFELDKSNDNNCSLADCKVLAVLNTPKKNDDVNISLASAMCPYPDFSTSYSKMPVTTGTSMLLVKPYTVTFDADGGTAVASAAVSYDTAISEPTDPKKTGYIFKGWYRDSAAVSYDFSQKVSENFTLKALWEKQWFADYTVSINKGAAEPKDHDGNPAGSFGSGNYLVLSKYNGADSAVEIPAETEIYGDKYITLLNGAVYSGKSSITSISMDSGTMIGSSCKEMFSGCSKLKKLYMHGVDCSHVNDKDNAFTGCTALEYIAEPKNTTAGIVLPRKFFEYPGNAAYEMLAGNGMELRIPLTVTFYANGSKFSTVSACYMGTVSAPASEPVSVGSALAGWCTDEAGTDQYDFKTGTVSQDMSLYASWKSAWYSDYTYCFSNNTDSPSANASTAAGSGYPVGNYLVITGYKGTGSNITVPAKTRLGDNYYTTVLYGSVYSDNSNITSISVDKGVYTGSECRLMFTGLRNLVKLDLRNLDTSRTTNMRLMFDEINAEEIEVSNFNTAKVTDMSSMFYHCPSLKSLDLNSFDTSNVTSMNYMFYQCSKMEKLDLTNFNLACLTDARSMFEGCSALEELYFGNSVCTKIANGFMSDFLTGDTSLKIFRVPLITSYTGTVGLPQEMDTLSSQKIQKRYTSMPVGQTSCELVRPWAINVYYMYKGGYTDEAFYVKNKDRFSLPEGIRRNDHYLAGWYTDAKFTQSFNAAAPITQNIGIYAKWNESWIGNYDYSLYENTESIYGSNGKFMGKFPSGNYIVLYKYINDDPDTVNIKVPAKVAIEGREYSVILGGSVYDGCSILQQISIEDGVMAARDCSGMFRNCTALKVLDLSGFDMSITSAADNMLSGSDGLNVILTPKNLGQKVGIPVDMCIDGQFEQKYNILPENKAASFVYVRPYTVSFDSYGGSPVADKTVSYDTAIASPAVPQKWGYTFSYWYLKESSVPYDFATAVTGNIKLTAKWDKQWFSDYTSGISGSDKLVLSKYNGVDTDIKIPAKTMISGNEYTTVLSGGVFKDQSGMKSISIDAGAEAGNTADSMFEGCTGLTGLDLSSMDFSAVSSGADMLKGCSSITLIKTPKKTGSTKIALPKNFYSYPGNTLYTALPENSVSSMTLAVPFTVSFRKADGTEFAKEEAYYYGTVSAPSSSPLKDDYEFTYWCTDAAGSHKYDFAAAVSGNMVLYPAWQDSRYKKYEYRFNTGTDKPLDKNGDTVAEFSAPGNYLVLSKYISADPLVEIPAYVLSGNGVSYNVILNGDVYYQKTAVTKIKLEKGVRTGKSCDYMFSGCSSLKTLDISGLDTSASTSMKAMFKDCGQPDTIDVSSFDTAHVTDMSDMFNSCSNVTKLDVGRFDTSSVWDMSDMFYGCSSVSELDVSNFNTENAGNFDDMFYCCSGLHELDISRFSMDGIYSDTVNQMFAGCSSLVTIFTPEITKDISIPFDAGRIYYGYPEFNQQYDSLPKEKMIIAIPYTVTFRAEGKKDIQQKVSYNGTVSAPSVTKTGWSVTKWSREDGTEYNINSPVSANITLNGTWERNRYTVNFDTDGGSSVSAQSVSYDYTVPEPQDPKKTGYTFKGWYTTESFNETFDFGNRKISENTVIYAKWDINYYKVTFDLAGGTGISSESVSYDHYAAKPENPRKGSLTFVGWYKDAQYTELFDFADMPVTGDMTVYAKFANHAIYIGKQSSVLQEGIAGKAEFSVSAQEAADFSFEPALTWVTGDHAGIEAELSENNKVIVTTTVSAANGKYAFTISAPNCDASTTTVTVRYQTPSDIVYSGGLISGMQKYNRYALYLKDSKGNSSRRYIYTGDGQYDVRSDDGLIGMTADGISRVNYSDTDLSSPAMEINWLLPASREALPDVKMGSDGVLTNMSADCIYYLFTSTVRVTVSAGEAGTYDAVSNTVLKNNTIVGIVKQGIVNENSNTADSEKQAVDFNIFKYCEATPEGSYSVRTGYISELVPAAAYYVRCTENGNTKVKSFTADKDGMIDIASDTALTGWTMYGVIKRSTAPEIADSRIQYITGKILKRHAAPAAGTIGYSKGIISGLTKGNIYMLAVSGDIMEISANGTVYALRDDAAFQGRIINAVAVKGDGENYSDSPYYQAGKWKVPYRVFFDANGAAVNIACAYTDTDKYVLAGGYSLPGSSTMVRRGYFFYGWRTEANGGYTVGSGHVYSSADTKIYAYWIFPANKSGMENSGTEDADDTTQKILLKGQKLNFDIGTWSTSNRSVAAVDSYKGTVTARKAGSAVVKSTGRSIVDKDTGEVLKYAPATYTITVCEPKISVKRLILLPGESGRVSLNGIDERLNVSWTSSNIKVAEVADGEVIATGTGSCTIRAYVNGRAYSCHVGVRQLPASPAKSAKEVTLNVQQQVQLRFSESSKVFNVSKAVWSVSDTDVASVTKGRVKGLHPGKTAVTGTYNGVTREVMVTVVALTQTSDIYINKGRTAVIRAYRVNNSKASWSSTVSSVAVVSDRGKVTGVSTGVTEINCVYNGVTYTVRVHVEDPAVVEDAYMVNITMPGTQAYSLLTLYAGQPYTVRLTGIEQLPKWRSNNPGVLFVDEFGSLKALKEGEAVLTARINGKTVRINVTVYPGWNEEQTAHDYTYNTVTVIEATKYHAGYVAHVCLCGAYYIERITYKDEK